MMIGGPAATRRPRRGPVPTTRLELELAFEPAVGLTGDGPAALELGKRAERLDGDQLGGVERAVQAAECFGDRIAPTLSDVCLDPGAGLDEVHRRTKQS